MEKDLFSVVVPALNEERTVARVVEVANSSSRVAEVIVVDNGSTDATAERAMNAGAVVCSQPIRGFGRAVKTGFQRAQHPWVLKLDADMTNPDTSWIERLANAMSPGVGLVKATWSNERDPMPVTNLLLRPSIKKFWPDLGSIDLPSGGIYLVNKDQLPLMTMTDGFSFDLEVLLRISEAGSKISQADLGNVYDRLRPIADYRAMAEDLLSFIVDAATGRRSILLVMAHPDDAEIWAGGLLIRAQESGRPVRLVIATGNGLRNKEALSLAAVFPSLDIETWSLPEFSGIGMPELTRRLADQIVSTRPDTIITHHHSDVHPDHSACFKMATGALLSAPREASPRQLWLTNSYFGNSTIASPFSPTNFIDTTSVMSQKCELIRNHSSQDSEFWIKMVRHMDALNGLRCGVSYAEAFETTGCFSTPKASL